MRRHLNLATTLIVSLVTVLLASSSSAEAQVLGTRRLKVAELVSSSAQISYEDSQNPLTIKHPGATHIKLNFSVFDIAPGDTVTVTSGDGNLSYRYPGDPSTQDPKYPGFWPLTIFGDTVTIRLNAADPSKSSKLFRGVEVARYFRGFSKRERQTINTPAIAVASLCGAKDYQPVECYAGQTQFEDEYEASNAVGILYAQGEQCTAWRVGPQPDTVITNEHCVENANELVGAEVWFGHQSACDGTSTGISAVIVTANQFLVSDAVMDLTLFTVNNPQSIETFGALEVDNRQAAVGEEIYIPQHPNDQKKQLAIFDSENNGQRCDVAENNHDGYGVDTDIAYTCDTEVGSSGAPVLSETNNKVIALHHFGGCLNSGARSDLFWPIIEPFLPTPLPVCDPYFESATILENLECTDYSTCESICGTCDIGDDMDDPFCLWCWRCE